MTEIRWIIVAQDGRHVALGRAAPPSDAEVARCAETLVAQGIVGAWLAELHGTYWGHRRVTLAPIRQIVPGGDWREAEARFGMIRHSAVPERPMRTATRRMNGDQNPRPAALG